MKKVFFTLAVLCTVAMMAGCKGGAANESTTPNEITWTSIENKLANKSQLDEADCMFILTDTTLDEGHSEGLGNYLFNYLCGYPKSNKLFSNAQKNFSSQEGDQKLISLMDLMSIDIALAEYENYDEFLGDFPMFKGCKGSEEEYNNIIGGFY